ncbi:MAG: ABC transporter permease [Longimicrobiales bacterium]|nr:ABC transporter permease [Longimicrobiales bacterium]
MSALVWSTEWRTALARRRLFALNVGVPLLLVAPIALSAAPAVHAAAVYAVLFVIHPTFGSAVPLVRDAEEGMVARVLRAGVRPATYLLQRAAAATLLDTLQLLPAVAVAWWGLGADGGALLPLLAGLLLTLWTANLVGVLVAAAARSVAESALFAAVAALLLLHASGVFRTGAPHSPAARVEAAAPFRALHEALLASGGTLPAFGIGASLAWAAVLAGVIVLVARRLGAALAGVPLRR